MSTLPIDTEIVVESPDGSYRMSNTLTLAGVNMVANSLIPGAPVMKPTHLYLRYGDSRDSTQHDTLLNPSRMPWVTRKDFAYSYRNVGYIVAPLEPDPILVLDDINLVANLQFQARVSRTANASKIFTNESRIFYMGLAARVTEDPKDDVICSVVSVTAHQDEGILIPHIGQLSISYSLKLNKQPCKITNTIP
jgi:hypothetical protein